MFVSNSEITISNSALDLIYDFNTTLFHLDSEIEINITFVNV